MTLTEENRIKTLEATLHATESQLNIKTNEVAGYLDAIRYWKRRAEKAEKKLNEAVQI